jgi:hypothetical protein
MKFKWKKHETMGLISSRRKICITALLCSRHTTKEVKITKTQEKENFRLPLKQQRQQQQRKSFACVNLMKKFSLPSSASIVAMKNLSECEREKVIWRNLETFRLFLFLLYLFLRVFFPLLNHKNEDN